MSIDFSKDDFLTFWGESGYVESWSGYEKDWTPEILNIVKKHTNPKSAILEIGCGGGYWTNKIIPNYAIDLIPRPAIDPRVIYIQNDTQEYKCKYIDNESIDFVFSFGVFCHLSLSACEEYLRDIYRVLKPNGKALLMYADQDGLRKHFKNPTLTCENICWKYNTYADTIAMVEKYPFTYQKMLEYRDTLLLLTKQCQ